MDSLMLQMYVYRVLCVFSPAVRSVGEKVLGSRGDWL